MHLHRLYGVVLRYWYCFIRSLDRLTEVFYWPTLDLVLWGITGLYMQGLAQESSNVVIPLISGVVLWNTAYRAQADLSISILEEIWSRNLINIFSSPLTFLEYSFALLSFSLVKTIVSVAFGVLIANLLYGFQVSMLSWYIVPLFLLLVLFGWTVGIFVCALILRYTAKVQALAWTLVWIFAPFAAAFFPLAILPKWIQTICAFVPASYVFEEMRNILLHKEVVWSNLGISLFLNLLYFGLACWYFVGSFKKVLERGLIKVY